MASQCKYCGQTKALIKAHLVPRCFYPKLEGQPHYLLTTDGSRPNKSWTGLYDPNILCAECDAMIGEFDQYACELLLPWPSRAHLLRESDGLVARGGDETRYAGYKLLPDVARCRNSRPHSSGGSLLVAETSSQSHRKIRL